jgi:phosphatidylinositol alpha 1,6-mannosyltransferase
VEVHQFRLSEFKMSVSTHPRVALFSGNYNYVKDGANQALNRLTEFLDKSGATVRVYSPTVANPAFEGYGEIVSVPSLRLPFGRSEYRLGVGLSGRVTRDLDAFKPDIVHVSCPDIVGHAAIRYARRHRLPVVASLHTRFETYPRFYRMKWIEPAVEALLRRFYRRCDRVLVPSASMGGVARAQRLNSQIDIWARGINHDRFAPSRRSDDYRARLGIDTREVVIGFCGRLVMEKGLDVFADALDQLTLMKVPHRVLIIGEGPAREWFQSRIPHGFFTGFLTGDDLAQAMASMDVFFNPSVTETFGNVTLEAMASGIPVVAADATGSQNLIKEGFDGRLIQPGEVGQFATALAQYCSDVALRDSHGAAAHDSSLKYDWNRINEKVLDHYRELIMSQKRRTPLARGDGSKASSVWNGNHGYLGQQQISSAVRHSGLQNGHE